ncbi:hypothetical protein JB92DRAFT_3108238 [Gautieria morchelliformis]|nr:hypothetical protein JB92DRAFT_3108238 [Gautieria morchelliformis]
MSPGTVRPGISRSLLPSIRTLRSPQDCRHVPVHTSSVIISVPAAAAKQALGTAHRLVSQPWWNPLTPSLPTQRGTMKRASSFANALKSIGSYAFTASDDEVSPAVKARQRPSSDQCTTSRCPSPPLSPSRGNAPSPNSDISPVHIMEALMEDMDRLRAPRRRLSSFPGK